MNPFGFVYVVSSALSIVIYIIFVDVAVAMTVFFAGCSVVQSLRLFFQYIEWFWVAITIQTWGGNLGEQVISFSQDTIET